MSTATQRKAWNEAMRNAGAMIPSSNAKSISGAVLLAGGSRVSDRRRKASRRDKARKSLFGNSASQGGEVSSSLERQYRVAVHLDLLEGVADNDVMNDDDEEYNEFEDLDGDDEEGRGTSKKKKRRKTAAVGSNASTGLPKYLRPRSLASILIEEASRSDSVAKQYVNASVRTLHYSEQAAICETLESNKKTTTYTKPYPPRKFCPVTGLFGVYVDPKSGIPYATLSALEQIRERAPPWMNHGYNGSASYWEAIKSVKDDA